MKEIAILLFIIYIGTCTYQISQEDKPLVIPAEVDWEFEDRVRENKMKELREAIEEADSILHQYDNKEG